MGIWTGFQDLDCFCKFELLLQNLDRLLTWELVRMSDLIETLRGGRIIELERPIVFPKEGKVYRVGREAHR